MSMLHSQQDTEEKENVKIYNQDLETVCTQTEEASSACTAVSNSYEQHDLYSLTSNERQQLVEERDAALEQLRWMEASRNDLARQQGQYKGKIAKLEGAINSGEKRLQASRQELEETKAQCLQLQAELQKLQVQVGVTPERCRTEILNLQAKAKKAVKLVYDTEARNKELAQVAQYEAQQRQELTDFASIEHKAAADAESLTTSRIATLETELASQTVALEVARKEAAEAHASLRSTQTELGRVTEAHAPCVAAAAKALQELVGLRLQVQQLAQDRVQAANNIRIAEKEVDLIHQANEQMFRYLNYVRSRLSSHITQLQQTPDLLHLLKDLHVWCTRESRGRALTTPMQAPAPSKTPGHTPAPKGLASRTPIPSRSRLGLFGA